VWRAKDQIEQLNLAEINPDGIKAYLDALDAVLENGGNEQKKYLLRGLVAKVLVHDKDRYEFTFKLPDGSTLQHALETVPEHEANLLYVNQLAHTVCNQEHAAPRTVVIANGRQVLLISPEVQSCREFPQHNGSLTFTP